MGSATNQIQTPGYGSELIRIAVNSPSLDLLTSSIVNSARGAWMSSRDLDVQLQETGVRHGIVSQHIGASMYLLWKVGVLRRSSKKVMSSAVATGNANHAVWLYQLVISDADLAKSRVRAYCLRWQAEQARHEEDLRIAQQVNNARALERWRNTPMSRAEIEEAYL